MRHTNPLVCIAVLLVAIFVTPAHALWPAGPFAPLNLDAPPHHGDGVLATSDDAGGFWASYFAPEGFGRDTTFVRRVDAAGNMPWPPTRIDSRFIHQWPTCIYSDGQGGALVGYDCDGLPAFYVQRVGPTGNVLWGETGIAPINPQHWVMESLICPDASGGCFVAWRTYETHVFLYHVLANGQLDPAWPQYGTRVEYEGFRGGLQLTAAGPGACILSYWGHASGGTGLDLILRRVLSSGAYDPSWPSGGLHLAAGQILEPEPASIPDGAGGCFIAWQRQSEALQYDICAQHVLAGGTSDSRWPATGRVVCSAIGDQKRPQLVSDLAGGIIVGWNDTRAGNYDVYTARVLADGSLDSAWPSQGRAMCTGDSTQGLAAMASDGRGGAGMFWYDELSLWDMAMVMGHVSSNGALDASFPPNGRRIASIPTRSWAVGGMIPDGAGGYLTALSTSYGAQALRFDRWGLAGAHPLVTALADTPNDEGGSVNVTFARSWLDTLPTLPIAAYRLWREVPSDAAAAKLAAGGRPAAFDDEHGSGVDAVPGDLRMTTDAAGVTRWWEMWTAVAGHADASYTVPVGTMCDATPTSSPHTYFMVEARAGDGVRAWVSPPDSCTSVDNLGPAAPASAAGVYGGGSVSLHWRPTTAGDFARYTVHRGSTQGFTPSAANLVATVTDTAWAGAANTAYWYRVRAVDVHGNDGASIAVLPSGSLDVAGDAASLAFALDPPAPNPSRDATSFRFTLPRDSQIAFTIHDAQGRVVRVLARGARFAGEHALAWDGRDTAGRAAPPGLYFARLTCDGRTLTRRLLRLP